MSNLEIPEEPNNFPKDLVLTVHTQPHWIGDLENAPMRHLPVGSVFHAIYREEFEDYEILFQENGETKTHWLPFDFMIRYFNIKKPGQIV